MGSGFRSATFSNPLAPPSSPKQGLWAVKSCHPIPAQRWQIRAKHCIEKCCKVICGPSVDSTFSTNAQSHYVSRIALIIGGRQARQQSAKSAALISSSVYVLSTLRFAYNPQFVGVLVLGILSYDKAACGHANIWWTFLFV